jgi:hypothetical protein
VDHDQDHRIQASGSPDNIAPLSLDRDLPFDRRRVQNNGGNAVKCFNHESTDLGTAGPPILGYELAVPDHSRPESGDRGRRTTVAAQYRRFGGFLSLALCYNRWFETRVEPQTA